MKGWRRGWDSPANRSWQSHNVYFRHEMIFCGPLASATIRDFPSPLLHEGMLDGGLQRY